MMLSFYKYHGTGNDFILVDNRTALFTADQKLIAWLCHRRFGIGADGLILLNQAGKEEFGMQYFNSDGRESTMCGNGGRCFVAFADFLSLPVHPFQFTGIDGPHTGHVIVRDGQQYQVMLSMKDVKEYRLQGNDFILDTGSPHLVRFVKDAANVDVIEEGRKARYSNDFLPDGINVNFVQIREEGLFIRTYERGVEDETLSCGTGVTASALAFALVNGLKKGVIQIDTPGGTLRVSFKAHDGGFYDINLEGQAVQVFSGVADLEDYKISNELLQKKI